ncbi:MAG TPA: tetratricopeptide repeat protein [Nitrospinota bacterium]|nr:tetratricopeptide repeat protein [Nitrospinota bacterium]
MKDIETSFNIPALIVIALLGFTAYSNSFYASFQFDDFISIVHNWAVHEFNLSSFWQHDAPRFIFRLSIALNYKYGGLNVLGYHIVNFFIHLLAAINVFWFVSLLYQTPVMSVDQAGRPSLEKVWPIAFLAALIFITHPIQTQAVIYIKQRATSLAALFYLLSMNLFLKSELAHKRGNSNHSHYMVLGLLSGVMGMMTKQNTFTLPFAICMISIYFFGVNLKNWREYLPRLLPWLLLLPIIPGLTWFYGSQEYWDLMQVQTLQKNLSPLEYFYTQLNVIVTYIRLVFLPYGQNLDYDYPFFRTLFEFRTFFALMFHLGVIAFAVSVKKKWPLISFCLLFFYLALSVESSFVPLEDVIFEHRLYLPGVAFFIIISQVIVSAILRSKHSYAGRWFNGKHPIMVCLVLALFSFPLIFMTMKRNNVWHTAESLWNDTLKKSPNKARPHASLGLNYLKNEKVNRAIYHLEKALELNPGEPSVRLSLGIAYGKLGQYEKALENIEKAAKESPYDFSVFYNFGSFYAQFGKFPEAIIKFKKAVQLAPKNKEALFTLAKAYIDNKQLEEGMSIYQKLIILPETSVENLRVIARDFNRLHYYKWAQTTLDEILKREKQ